jgi:inhibitor of KinA
VERHCGAPYRVYMLGFQPGFAYLGALDPRIAAPRRAVPRVHVPAGSVGIAARQTGVYPVASPGGWQLVGQTPVRLFDMARRDPFLLSAGDLVRFEPIDEAAYGRLETGQP